MAILLDVKAPSVPACAILGGCIAILISSAVSLAQMRIRRDTPAIVPANRTPILEMTAEELRENYASAVGNLKSIPDQDALAGLLKKTGERVEAFFRAFSDTSSREYVLLQHMSYNGGIEDSTSLEYYYLIVHHPSKSAPLIEEYRTDKKNNPVAQDAINGYFMTSGFACLSLHFHPSRRKDLNFRYLGRQDSGPHAHIIAFAERLDSGNILIHYTDSHTGESTRLPVQGFAWIDPDTFQILRLRTYLQNTSRQINLSEQITDVKFSEVSLDAARKFWMPHEVLVTTVYGNRTYRTLHRYSDYRHFAVNSDYKIDRPKGKSN